MDALERTVRTFAQALLATGLLSNPLGMDARAVLISSGATAGVSLLSALAWPAKSTAPVIAVVPAKPKMTAVVGQASGHEG